MFTKSKNYYSLEMFHHPVGGFHQLLYRYFATGLQLHQWFKLFLESVPVGPILPVCLAFNTRTSVYSVTDEIFRPEDEKSYVSNHFWTWKT